MSEVTAADILGMSCPIPIADYPHVLLAHGGGGRLTHMLIERVFARAFANPALAEMHDGAVLDLAALGVRGGLGLAGGRLAISTDSFVVSPLFFPGGDIGSLAVHGTVNDLAMCGARPLALTAGFIIEEGLLMDDLWKIVRSMAAAAAAAGVSIVSGDTKVVDRGKGDGVFINTTGIGVVPEGVSISPRAARAGDAILVNGAVAEHGIAIMSVREGLEFETALESDSAALHGLVAAVLEAAGADVHVLRDPTRGGVSSALNEIAQASSVGVRLDEASVPLGEAVRAACEILGLDPLYVANEGKVLAIVAREAADRALAAMRAHPLGRQAAVIGEVVGDHPGKLYMKSRIGGLRVVDMLSGEQLPRIC